MALHPEVKKFLSNAGKIGGSSKSDKKVLAVRANGKLGGRPKGSKNVRPKKSVAGK